MMTGVSKTHSSLPDQASDFCICIYSLDFLAFGKGWQGAGSGLSCRNVSELKHTLLQLAAFLLRKV